MILTIIIWLALLSFIGVVLYVLGTYLVFGYDRRVSGEHASSPQLHFREKVRGVIREIFATWRCVLFYPFGLMKGRIRPGVGIPILLIHGFNHNRSAWFSLSRKLHRAGFANIHAINLRRGNHCIADQAEWVMQQAKELQRNAGVRELILIGHSMGGLVACHCAVMTEGGHAITHVMTLGAPLHGTRMAVLAGGHACQEMRVGSPYTDELCRAIGADHRVRYFHLGSWFDNMVIPSESAVTGKRPGHERLFPDVGHLTMLFSSKVAQQVIDWLRSTVPYKPQPVTARPLRESIKKAPAEPRESV